MGQSFTKATVPPPVFPVIPGTFPDKPHCPSHSPPTRSLLCRSSLANDESAQNPQEVEEITNESFPEARALGAESQWEEICKDWAARRGDGERRGQKVTRAYVATRQTV